MDQSFKSMNTLNQQKIENMLRLQELFHNHYLSVQLLHQLISLYTSAIQLTDEDTSPFRIYFVEKIQFILSRPQIQKMLQNVNNIADKGLANNLRETLRQTSRDNNKDYIQAESPTDIKKLSRLQNYDGQNEKQKCKKIQMQFKLMEQMQQGMENLSKTIENQSARKLDQKNKIKNVTKQQNQKLEQRILMRKKNRKRKASFDDKQGLQIENLKKCELLQAQKQINEAVIRITNRIVQNDVQIKTIQNQNSKGRIKKSKRNHDKQ